MEHIKDTFQAAVQQLYDVDMRPELSRPAEQFGDYATNVALQLAGKLGKQPREIAHALIDAVKHDDIAKLEMAGPGFINITLTDAALKAAVGSATEWPTDSAGQEILAEFGDPNPFKEMHLGHLYTAIVGDSIARLLEARGADVKRLSYHGDVGMHVAKWIWAVKQLPDWKDEVTKAGDALGTYYAQGAAAFEADEQAAAEIRDINEHIYKRDDDLINEIYDWGREESFKKFDQTFADLGVKYVKRYLESQSAEAGRDLVRQHTPGVFTESDGAVVYKGEKVGLHTRVFITSRGLPTYEAKDLGLAGLKDADYPDAARSIIITANEQTEYFKVMLAALNEIKPELAQKTTHLAHGFLALTTGKMSSRTGKVYAAAALLDAVRETVTQDYPDADPANQTYLAAVKYSLLKNRLGGDIVFDVEDSVSLDGNSGPYLQYAHARARSVLSKASADESKVSVADKGNSAKDAASGPKTDEAGSSEYQPGERTLARKISEFPEAVQLATNELMPHHICTYLYDLAGEFNRFYENNRVIGDERQAERLTLVRRYADVLKSGLDLLGIVAPEKM
jgi:arginyl-tRNA synthetase